MHVRAVDLHGETPFAMYDSRRRLDIGIDFTRTPAEITSAVQDALQEAFDTGRLRRSSGGHTSADEITRDGASPHPEGPH